MKYIEPKIKITGFQSEAVFTASGPSVDKYLEDQDVKSTLSTSMDKLRQVEGVVDFN